MMRGRRRRRLLPSCAPTNAVSGTDCPGNRACGLALRCEGGDVSGAQPEASAAKAACGLGADGQADADADEIADQPDIAADAELAAELLLWIGHITGTPSPSRCGRVRYKPCRIMRMWVVSSIKFVFLKDLSLNLSSHWS
jgi:hypothetical protein